MPIADTVVMTPSASVDAIVNAALARPDILADFDGLGQRAFPDFNPATRRYLVAEFVSGYTRMWYDVARGLFQTDQLPSLLDREGQPNQNLTPNDYLDVFRTYMDHWAELEDKRATESDALKSWLAMQDLVADHINIYIMERMAARRSMDI